MILICVDELPGFTIGNEYSYEWEERINWRDWKIKIKNDLGEDLSIILNQWLITFLPPSNIWVEYIGQVRDGLTPGKYYNLLERGNISINDEHYYILDDNNKFIGAYRGNNWRDCSISRMREIRLNELGI